MYALSLYHKRGLRLNEMGQYIVAMVTGVCGFEQRGVLISGKCDPVHAKNSSDCPICLHIPTISLSAYSVH